MQKCNLFPYCFVFLFSLRFLFASAQTTSSGTQNNVSYVDEYKLDNGLTVYLNEDHGQPTVFGAVVVKGGSKVDPPDATGIAHYLEHMMFKGTDEIGTSNFQQEVVYLDSINDLYDMLATKSKHKDREFVQLQINRLSQKAAEFVILDDLDNILESIGSVDINAYTSEDCIVYHNLFPPHQLEKWLNIYSHRFISPVFRSFQSELEVVYEEKNMYSDDVFSSLYEDFCFHFFKKHPYGQETVLGRPEHLKNPSLTKMYNYFNTYYVPNNMALVISGDFNREVAKALINGLFGKWKQKGLPERTIPREDPFTKREVVRERTYPLKSGYIGFRGVSANDPDNISLEICTSLLHNMSNTGLLDVLFLEGKVLSIDAFLLPYSEAGGIQVSFEPVKKVSPLRKTERLILSQIARLRAGDFDDELLQAVKYDLIIQHEKSMEVVMGYDQESDEYIGRPNLMIDAFVSGKNWSDVVDYSTKVNEVTRADILRVAQTYFSDNYLAFYSLPGFKKKTKLEKPSFAPIVISAGKLPSVFKVRLDSIRTQPSLLSEISFTEDVQIDTLEKRSRLFYLKNHINTIFTLSLNYGVGYYEMPILDPLSSYLNYCGTTTMSHDSLKKILHALGSTIEFSCSKDYFTATLRGFDNQLDTTLKLYNELLMNTEWEDQITLLVSNNTESEQAMESYEPLSLAEALWHYVLYRDQSPYINRLSSSEIRETSTEDLLSNLIEALRYDRTYHYTGSLEKSELLKLLENTCNSIPATYTSNSPTEPTRLKVDSTALYFLNQKNAVQSHVYLYINGETLTFEERCHAEVFSDLFSQQVYNEIRDFRSLAYTAGSSCHIPVISSTPVYTWAYLSTQADKTNDAVEALHQLFKSFNISEELLEHSINSLVNSMNTNNPSFRDKPYWVELMVQQGFQSDPRPQMIEVYRKTTLEDLQLFYNKCIRGKPITLMVVGDKHWINIEKLSQSYPVIAVEKSQVQW